MKKFLVVLLAIATVAVVAAPARAGVEFKYGGMFATRFISDDNVNDGTDKMDDNGNWVDQRLRMYFSFIASERLQVVTKWEANTSWGNEVRGGTGAGGGGDVGADATNLQMKNVYVDFLIPNTPLRAKLGVQGIALLTGWIVDDDFSGAVISTTFEPFKVQAGYIAAQNEDVTDASENIDDLFVSMDYADGPFSASVIGFYQYGHDNSVSATAASAAVLPVEDNNLFDLGINLGYKLDWMSVFLNFVQNLGSYDVTGDRSYDYRGRMIEAGASFFVNDFTFTLGGFYTSGDDDANDGDDDAFAYPVGKTYYWAEIMGYGTLDAWVSEASNGKDLTAQEYNNGGYGVADRPSNLWTVSLGASWQALETTKLTLNYYYTGTSEDVVSNAASGEKDSWVGNELDFYLDQAVVDGLNLRLVAAYLWAGDAYTTLADDDNAYELGAQLLWEF
mgnify:CR=1 FL=1